MNEKKILMVIAPSNFRDEELFHPKEVFENAGVKVTIASLKKGEIIGSLGGKVIAEIPLDEIYSEAYDAIVFIGGGGASIYFENEIAQNLAKEFNKKGKVVSAICIAPSILANANLLEGKKVTAFPSEQQNLESKGAIFTNEPVTIDGKIITANGPKSAKKFAQEIITAIRT